MIYDPKLREWYKTENKQSLVRAFELGKNTF